MALAWCTYVNGKSVFPKLLAYLRIYETTWLRNQAARSAMASAKPKLDILRQVMKQTSYVSTVPPPVPPALSAAQTAPPAAPAAPPMALPIAQYTSMPLPTAVSEQDEGGRTVGSVAIEAAVVSISKKPKARKRGECTGDKKKRACGRASAARQTRTPTAKHAEGGTRVTARQSVNSSTQLGRRDRHSRTSMRRAARRQRRRRRSIRLPKASSRNRVKLYTVFF